MSCSSFGQVPFPPILSPLSLFTTSFEKKKPPLPYKYWVVEKEGAIRPFSDKGAVRLAITLNNVPHVVFFLWSSPLSSHPFPFEFVHNIIRKEKATITIQVLGCGERRGNPAFLGQGGGFGGRICRLCHCFHYFWCLSFFSFT